MKTTTPSNDRVVSHRPASALVQRSFRCNLLDVHFLASASVVLGISQSELLRRILFSARDNFVKANLYSLPRDLRVIPVMMQALAKFNRGGRRQGTSQTQDTSAGADVSGV
jgi:hypothetical protein